MLTRAKAQAAERPRKFYAAAAPGAVEGSYSVLLDSRPAKTPGGKPLTLPAHGLAELLAAEWDAQTEVIAFGDMPATRLAFTVIDHIPAARAGVAEEVATYAGSDMLCYLAEAPRELAERQQAAWGPIRDWAGAELDLRFQPVTGVIHKAQPSDTLAGVHLIAIGLDDFALGALAHATSLFGSAILALALQRGRLTGQEAFDLSRLDEVFQEEQWGVDDEAAVRTARMRAEAATLEAWFASLLPPDASRG